MRASPAPALLSLMIAAQGMLGYGAASVFGAIPAELFQGRHYGTVFGSLSLAAIVRGALVGWAAVGEVRRGAAGEAGRAGGCSGVDGRPLAGGPVGPSRGGG